MKPYSCIDCGKEITLRRFLYIGDIEPGPRCNRCHAEKKQRLGIPPQPHELKALAAAAGGRQK